MTPKAHDGKTGQDILDEVDSASQILRIIPRTMRHLRSELRSFAKPQLTVPQFRILIHLSEHKALNNGQLAEIQGVSVAAMSRMADGLVRRDLLARNTSPSDRRQIHLSLTTKGREVLDRVMTSVRSNLADRLSKLDSKPRSELSSGLRILEEIFR